MIQKSMCRRYLESEMYALIFFLFRRAGIKTLVIKPKYLIYHIYLDQFWYFLFNSPKLNFTNRIIKQA